MTFVWIGLGLVLLVVGVTVVIGFFLPERYEGRSQVEYAAAPEQVWGALMDYERHPMTGKMAKGFQELPEADGLPAWTEDMGRGESIRVTTTESKKPIRLVREMTSAAVPMTSRWVYDLEPTDEGSRLTLEGTTDIKRGTWHVPIFRFMMVVGGGVKKGLDIQMDMVAASLGVEAQRE